MHPVVAVPFNKLILTVVVEAPFIEERVSNVRLHEIILRSSPDRDREKE